MAFTIHGIDQRLERALTDRARREGTSKNRLVKRLLARALGLGDPRDPKDDYREFLGLWSEEEAATFTDRQRDNASVDSNDWK